MKVLCLFLAVCLLIAPVLAFTGCRAQSPQDEMRAVIVLTAQAVETADQFCAQTALAQSNLALAQTCTDAYNSARPGLLAAEAGLDSGYDANAACAVKDALLALTHVSEALKAAGVDVPGIVQDAQTFAGKLHLCSQS